MVNPTKRAEYTVHTLATKQRFSSRLALASELSNSFPECNSSKVWYILPGHGFKGKRLLIGCDEDLQKLYEQSKRKRIMISLDCGIDDTPPPKRVRRALLDQPSDASDNVPATVSKTKKQSKSEAKMSRVQDIVERLKEKHGSNYSIEKLNCWAHMLDMEKHRSYDEPPNLPFFGTKAKTTSTANQVMTSSDSVVDISPGKLVKMRGDSISQINMWHNLLEKGAITREQYSKLQERILSDINFH